MQSEFESHRAVFNRVERLVGSAALDRFARARVIIFGLGGVGSWTAEALARSGVGSLTLVDADVVALSNINRQLPAMLDTVGRSKVEVMARRIARINPACRVTTRCERYDAASAPTFPLEEFDAVVDAIDSPADKTALILHATSCPLPTRLFSSMGAALRTEPWRVRVDEFRRVQGDALAAVVRRRMRRDATMPRRKFKCVYSEEPRRQAPPDPPADTSGAMTYGKVAVNGAVVTVTATFGMCLAALVLDHLAAREG